MFDIRILGYSPFVTKKTLFHYTAPANSHLGNILESGVLKPSESNARLDIEHAAPDVVWCVDEPIRPGEDHGLLYHSAHKTMGSDAETLGNIKQQARITLSVPATDAFLWLDWIKTQNHKAPDVAVMVKTGGGMEQAKHWWVVPRPVPAREWVEVVDFTTGNTWIVNPLTGKIGRVA